MNKSFRQKVMAGVKVCSPSGSYSELFGGALFTRMTALENATQKSMARPTHSVQYKTFLWASCQELVLSTIYRIPPLSGTGSYLS